MSIVRYVNKKTGAVALYESTSHYDPETKQSRPRRRYLGIEDPETGALIPSSGKRGRKKATVDSKKPRQRKTGVDYKEKYDELQKECAVKDERIKYLEHENKRLRFCITKLRDTAADMLVE